MTPDLTVGIMREAVGLVALLVAAIITPSLIIGLIVSMFQAATQINEQTLSFLPKLLVTLLAMVLFGPWMLNLVLEFTNNLFLEIPRLIG